MQIKKTKKWCRAWECCRIWGLLPSIVLAIGFAKPTGAAVTIAQSEGKYTLENEWVALRVDPAQGGCIDQYQIKSNGVQMVHKGGGLLLDHFWQQPWPGEFLYKPYDAKIIAQTPEAVTLEVTRTSQGYNGLTDQKDLRVTRRLTLRENSPALEVEVAIENLGNIGRSAGYWNQNILLPSSDDQSQWVMYRPTVRGVSEAHYTPDPVMPKIGFNFGAPDGFVRDPQNAWMAALGGKNQSGLAFVAQYDELLYLYNALPTYTSEWQYRNTSIPAGKTWRTNFVVYPLPKMSRVDYATKQFAVGVTPTDANGQLTTSMELISAAQKLENLKISGEMLSARDPKIRVPLTPSPGVSPTTGAEVLKFAFAAPHIASEPVVLRYTVTATQDGKSIKDTFDLWYGGTYGYNRNVALDPLYTIAPPPRHITLLKPDVITKTLNSRPRVLICKGLYADDYLPGTLFSQLGAEVTTSFYKPPGQFPATLNKFPSSYEELMAYDVIALINIDTEALGAGGQEMLKDFVERGGVLLYGGDFWAYGRAGVTGTTLESLLPVSSDASGKTSLTRLRDGRVFLRQAAELGATDTLLSAEGRVLYLTGTFRPKPGATVLMRAEDAPLLVGASVGEGYVLALTGTALGAPTAPQKLWTSMPQWSEFMAHLLRRNIKLTPQQPA